MSSPADVRAIAMQYAKTGMPLFPCRPDNKRPFTKHGFKDATADLVQVEAWWRQFPTAMIGVPTGAATRFFVLDVDIRNGVDGEATLAKLAAEHGALLETLSASTPSGGRHFFFRYPGHAVKNRAGHLGPGLDIRGDGGYVVLAPSVNAAGGSYAWVEPRQPMRASPSWLLELLEDRRQTPSTSPHPLPQATNTPYADAAFNAEIARVAMAQEGTRNDTLNKAAYSLGQLVGAGALSPDQVEAGLMAAAECNGSVSDDGSAQASKTIESGLRAGMESPRAIPEARVNRANHPCAVLAGETADDASEIQRLAALSSFAYERERESAASRLNVRVGTLDKAVMAARGDEESYTGGQGRKLELPEIEPWHEPVDGAVLLNNLANAIRRYVVLEPSEADAAALWIVGAHCFEAFTIFPRLAVTSPEKGCGKTTCLDVIGAMVPRALPTANTTAAALFRVIEAAQPTLLIDEADTFLKDNEELRGILNSGHRRGGSVTRVVGDDHEPRIFSTWAPTAIALIGRLPDTLEDRSIPLRLRRRRPDETVERFRSDRIDGLVVPARMAARWAADHRSAIADADPVIPDSLHNRAADNWRPMLAISDAVGGEWPERARKAAQANTAGAEATMSYRVQLLADIQSIFEAKGVDRLSSADLLGALYELEDRPWMDWKFGKPFSAVLLARSLKEYRISPSTIRLGDGRTPKGYYRSDLDDAFSRYVPKQNATPPQP